MDVTNTNFTSKVNDLAVQNILHVHIIFCFVH